MSAETPPHRTACSPKLSVSVSSLKVVSRTPARVEPIPLAQAKASFEQFRDDHPDLLSNPAIKEGVSKLLKSNKTINVENAYWVVKGRLAEKEKVAQAQVKQVRRDTNRAAAQMVGLGVRPRGFRASTDEDRTNTPGSMSALSTASARLKTT